MPLRSDTAWFIRACNYVTLQLTVCRSPCMYEASVHNPTTFAVLALTSRMHAHVSGPERMHSHIVCGQRKGYSPVGACIDVCNYINTPDVSMPFAPHV
jgi:hypothetical protein